VCLDRQATHDNDAPALLDFVENPLEVTIERWVAAILPKDLA
jgi:hypothetical protein